MEKSIQIPSDMIRQFENLPLLEHLKALLNTAVTFSRRTPNIVIIGANVCIYYIHIHIALINGVLGYRRSRRDLFGRTIGLACD